MDYFPTSFSGFNKKTKFYEGEFLKDRKEWKGDYHFDEKLYESVSSDIISVLGKKDVYTGQEAYYYFHKRYFAFPIPYRNIHNYGEIESVDFGAFDKHSFDDDGCLDKFANDEGEYFSYLKHGRLTAEKTITLVIDMSNEVLRKRFPSIQKEYDRFESLLVKDYGSFTRMYEGLYGYFVKDPKNGETYRIGGHESSVILVIGSFDNKTINSMNVLIKDGFIDELGYAVEFFRRHS